jgi:hypothetical protein
MESHMGPPVRVARVTVVSVVFVVTIVSLRV